jgi:hypothetical protein
MHAAVVPDFQSHPNKNKKLICGKQNIFGLWGNTFSSTMRTMTTIAEPEHLPLGGSLPPGDPHVRGSIMTQLNIVF